MANVYVRSGAGGTADGSSWANAYLTLAAALTAKAAGDDFWVAEDHAETQASAMTLTSPGTAASPCRIICVNHAGTVPPVSADLRTTATVSTTGASTINFNGAAYCYGITFTAGNSTNNASLVFYTTGSLWYWRMQSCTLALGGTGISGRIDIGIGGGAVPALLELINTSLQFANASQGVRFSGAVCIWIGGSVLGTAPTTLVLSNSNAPGMLLLDGVDLSLLGSGTNLFSVASTTPKDYRLANCKLGSSVSVTTGSIAGQGGIAVRMVNCDSADTNYRYYKQTYQGTITQETVIVRTGGATDGTTPVSRKMVSTANSKLYSPLESDWIYFWANTIGSTTVSIYTVTDNVTLTTADIDVQVEYPGTASFPLGLFDTSGVADVLATGSNYATDTSTWTTTGIVTPVKQVMSKAVTLTGKGLVRARVRLSKASTTVYFDPLVLASSGRQFMVGESYANEAVQSGGGGGMLFIPGLDGV